MSDNRMCVVSLGINSTQPAKRLNALFLPEFYTGENKDVELLSTPARRRAMGTWEIRKVTGRTCAARLHKKIRVGPSESACRSRLLRPVVIQSFSP